MIARIEGSIVAKTTDALIIDTGGVGYRVYTTPQILSGAGDRMALYTYLSVRETALDLFGFQTLSELSFFEMLLSVSGIGPRSALAILGMAEPSVIASAISKGDSSYLTSVSGIGRKTAEKIVVELRDKVGTLGTDMVSGDGDAVEALKSLGYSAQEAREALRLVPGAIEDTAKRITEALKYLGKK